MLKGDILSKKGKQITLLRSVIMSKSALFFAEIVFFSWEWGVFLLWVFFFFFFFFGSSPLGGLWEALKIAIIGSIKSFNSRYFPRKWDKTKCFHCLQFKNWQLLYSGQLTSPIVNITEQWKTFLLIWSYQNIYIPVHHKPMMRWIDRFQWVDHLGRREALRVNSASVNNAASLALISWAFPC